ncbi:hypothetical protein [Oceanicoccus sagamiensis]|uniref:Uncharacterized protein n=1 Tax=Oceanicoccus sagamiensis TaxID=716816 RepID=A0A1X9NHT1_9GAMM|nr:hypothetical protein [Oceanicoccus sagamiensis]ARN75069.1 hypothetical protein BST96_13660 [Oceanicoccus sagamiensis]
MGKTIVVNDSMQTHYSYQLVEPAGKNFEPGFSPELSPKELLALGVFGGKYLNDCQDEFPKSWFSQAVLSPLKKDVSLNYFRVDASLPLSHWRGKGWIYHEDPRGWFQWYCRYYRGRRIELEDQRQIKRWRNMRRHIGAVKKNCEPGDCDCRRKQRQALLHWAYDSRIL